MNRRQVLTNSAKGLFGLATSIPLLEQINYYTDDCDCSNGEEIRICCNENPYGPSLKARKAIEQHAKNGYRYPRALLDELKKQIAAANGLSPDHVFLGAGSASILQLTGLWIGLKKKNILSADYTFRWLMRYAEPLGSEWIKVPLTDQFLFDLDGLSAKIDESIGLIYLVNPNNPTGTYIPAEQIHSFCKKHSSTCPVFLDEAYIEYIPGHEKQNSAALIKDHPNLMVCRTFSKLYGMAGLRVGYLLASPERVKELEQLDIGFGMSISCTSAAAALASLEDIDFKQNSYKQNLSSKTFTEEHLKRWGIPFTDAKANFLHADVSLIGPNIKQHLKEKNIALNPLVRGDKTYLRISMGSMHEMEEFVKRMEPVFGG